MSHTKLVKEYKDFRKSLFETLGKSEDELTSSQLMRCIVVSSKEGCSIIIGENHIDLQNEKNYDKFVDSIKKFINDHKEINIYIEKPEDDEITKDMELYDDYLDSVGIETEKKNSKSLFPIFQNIGRQYYNFDIREKVNDFHDGSGEGAICDVFIQSFANIDTLDKDSKDKHAINIVTALDHLIESKNIQFLLKNKETFAQFPQTKIEYHRLLKQYSSATQNLYDSIQKYINGKEYMENIVFKIHDIMFTDPQELCDLYLIRKILKQKSKYNIIFCGSAHVLNISRLFFELGYSRTF